MPERAGAHLAFVPSVPFVARLSAKHATLIHFDPVWSSWPSAICHCLTGIHQSHFNQVGLLRLGATSSDQWHNLVRPGWTCLDSARPAATERARSRHAHETARQRLGVRWPSTAFKGEPPQRVHVSRFASTLNPHVKEPLAAVSNCTNSGSPPTLTHSHYL